MPVGENTATAMSKISGLFDPVKRTVALLALCQAFFMSVQSAMIATTPLAGYMLLGLDKSYATVPLFLTYSAIMMATIPASFFMKHFGRRAGFSLGALIGTLAGLISAMALYQQSFLLLCVGSLMQGFAVSFANFYRFAAADISDDNFRPKAISLVMAGGVLAGFMGPEGAKWAMQWFAPQAFLGVYVLVAIFSMLILLTVQGMTIPRPSIEERASGGRPMREISRQPAFRVSVLSSMLGYGVMTLLMTTTPLAMMACGFHFDDSATVIQVHVVAMFLPSFFTGHLIKRFGALRIIGIGAIVEAACALINLAGIDFTNFIVGSALLAIGWNFTYVGGTVLLTTTYEPAERAKVQAAHDFSVFGMTAVAAALSGYLQQKAGWSVVNLVVLPAMFVVLSASLWLRRRQSALLQAAE